MKKYCVNCAFADFAKVYNEYQSIADMMADEDYLVCQIKNAKTDDYNTCKKWMKSKAREADIKAGC